MKPTNDNDNECMFIDQTDKAEYIRAEDHKIVLDKLKKVEQSNKNITTDLHDAMKYITQLEKYVYKMESDEIYDEDMEVVDEVDEVDEVVDEDTDETDVDIDEPSNETDVDDENIVTEDEIRFVKWFDNNKDYSSNWEKNLKIVQDIKLRLFKQQNNITDCMFKNHKKKANQLNEKDVDEDIDETDDDKKDIDFIEIGSNVFLNKKTNQTYEMSDDNDLDEDIF